MNDVNNNYYNYDINGKFFEFLKLSTKNIRVFYNHYKYINFFNSCYFNQDNNKLILSV